MAYASTGTITTSSVTPAASAETERAVEAKQAARKTMAAKVLSAIALERVTGRKPDPSRFAELN